MGYVGNQTTTSFTSMDKQTITGSGATTYTLSHNVSSESEIEVFVNNIRQEGGSGKAYTVSNNQITFSEAVTSSDSIYVVFQGKAIQTVVPPDASVGTAKIADDAVTTAKILNNNITTAKIANNAIGSTQLAQANIGWEHIETKVWSSGGSANEGTGQIRFKECFSTNYICYKLVIGRLQTGASNNEDFILRYATGTGGTFTVLDSSDYFWGMTRQSVQGNSNSSYGGSATSGRFWTDYWNNSASGIHGEIDFYNMTAPVINSVNTDKGSYYRPILKFSMIGYNNSAGYELQTGLIRYNPNEADDNATGFLIDAVADAETGTHMSLFGLRSPV
tara:strand:+ start:652 stop:1650 length:999 start_codon:yes stop_codon:yes gene_type:complete